MSSTKLLEPTALAKIITSIGRRGVILDRDIQLCAVNAVGYSIEHGDVRAANQLYENLPQGTRRASLIKYFETYGDLAYMAQTSKKFEHDKRQNKDGEFKTFNYDALMGTLWYQAKSEVLVSEVNVIDMVSALIKRAETAISKQRTVKGSDFLDELKALMGRYEMARMKAMEEEEQKQIVDAAKAAAA